MPTYQYACTACHERLEAVQSFSDPALTECPACGGALRKVFSAVGVVFKGSGFYKTDSRANGATKPKTDASSSSDGAGSSTGGSSDSSASASGSSANGSKESSSAGGGSGSSKPATTTAPASKSA